MVNLVDGRYIVSRLYGGLGNQMFQYAAARAVAMRVNAPLHLDLSLLGVDSARDFALAPFSIEVKVASPTQKKNVANPKPLIRIIRRIRRRLGWSGGIQVFTERSYRYDSGIKRLTAPVVLDGYFQSERYFADIRERIVQDFTLRHKPSSAAEALLNKISTTDSIGLHIRRGDYVKNPIANAYHGTCSLDYYRRGVEVVTRGLERPHCFLFSDDPDWVRINFKAEVPTTLVDIHGPLEAHEDLRLMAACRCYVIANSSFSWWGAWLGSHPGKVVVAPQRWFRDVRVDTSDLIPSDWRRL